MADLLGTLSSNYLTVGANTRTGPSRYTDVDADSFQGRWSGTYANNQKFEIQVSDIQGFRAKVRYQSGAVTKFQDVLIRDNAFRVGDSKFTLTRAGVAQIKTVMTDGTGASSMETAYARQG